MNKRPKKYLLDGEPIDARKLIQQAVDSGMENNDGLFSTSVAAHFLRTRCGCTVEDNLNCE